MSSSSKARWRAWAPPLRDRRFWAVQAMVAAIAGVHDLVEAGGYLPHLGMLYFVPISLFFVPVVYAGLHFGFRGSVATSLWIVLITIPNWVFWHAGTERWGVIFQITIVTVLAALVGRRVDKERAARAEAERYEQHLRRFAEQLVSAQEHERNRIARDLHDDAVQALAVLARRLDELDAAVSSGSTPPERIKEARRLARDALDAIRRVVRGLRPPVLDDLGLIPALRQLATETRSGQGPQVAVYVTGQPARLDPECELGLYRIVQEALCNVIRHARASRAAVCVAFGRGHVRLLVTDNGVGLRHDGARRPVRPDGRPSDYLSGGSGVGGLGLVGMSERARSMGGQLRIHSRPGRGTTLLVTVPYASPDSRLQR